MYGAAFGAIATGLGFRRPATKLALTMILYAVMLCAATRRAIQVYTVLCQRLFYFVARPCKLLSTVCTANTIAYVSCSLVARLAQRISAGFHAADQARLELARFEQPLALVQEYRPAGIPVQSNRQGGRQCNGFDSQKTGRFQQEAFRVEWQFR